MGIINFILSQSLRKQTAWRWGLVVLYLILIFPAIILMAFAQKSETKQNKRKDNKMQWTFFGILIFYSCYMSPTMFLTSAIGIAALGSTFSAYIPLFWFILLLLSLIGFAITNYLQKNPNEKQKNTDIKKQK